MVADPITNTGQGFELVRTPVSPRSYIGTTYHHKGILPDNTCHPSSYYISALSEGMCL